MATTMIKPRHFNLSTLLCVLVIISFISFLALLQHCRLLINRSKTIKSLTRILKPAKEVGGLNVEAFTSSANLKNRGSDLGIEYHSSHHKLLANLTRDPLTEQFFTEVDKLKVDDFIYKIRLTESNNKIRHKFLIRGQSICRGHKPFLLIILPSMLNHFDIRHVIRKTWMKAALSNKWPGVTINKKVRYLFFLGKNSNFNDSTFRQLKYESLMYRDIVLSEVIDSYRNLSRKMVSAMQWVKRYCAKAEYVMKLDEDTFVNIPLIIKVISEAAKKIKSNRFVLGKSHSSFTPEVVRNGRWAVSEAEYPFNVFPRYMYGHSYVFSRASIPSVVAMADHVALIPPEDVYLTGILSKLANVTRINAACFTVCCIDLFDCDVVWNRLVTLTAVSSTEDHIRLWKSVTERKCHPKIAFNHKIRYPHIKPVTDQYV